MKEEWRGLTMKSTFKMKRVGLGALLASALLFVLAGAPEPQQDGGCEAACEDQARACIGYCGDHDNPMECEARCHEQNEDCVHECRR